MYIQLFTLLIFYNIFSLNNNYDLSFSRWFHSVCGIPVAKLKSAHLSPGPLHSSLFCHTTVSPITLFPPQAHRFHMNVKRQCSTNKNAFGHTIQFLAQSVNCTAYQASRLCLTHCHLEYLLPCHHHAAWRSPNVIDPVHPVPSVNVNFLSCSECQHHHSETIVQLIMYSSVSIKRELWDSNNSVLACVTSTYLRTICASKTDVSLCSTSRFSNKLRFSYP